MLLGESFLMYGIYITIRWAFYLWCSFENASWLMARTGFSKLYLVGFRAVYTLKHNQVLYV